MLVEERNTEGRPTDEEALAFFLRQNVLVCPMKDQSAKCVEQFNGIESYSNSIYNGYKTSNVFPSYGASFDCYEELEENGGLEFDEDSIFFIIKDKFRNIHVVAFNRRWWIYIDSYPPLGELWPVYTIRPADWAQAMDWATPHDGAMELSKYSRSAVFFDSIVIEATEPGRFLCVYTTDYESVHFIMYIVDKYLDEARDEICHIKYLARAKYDDCKIQFKKGE